MWVVDPCSPKLGRSRISLRLRMKRLSVTCPLGFKTKKWDNKLDGTVVISYKITLSVNLGWHRMQRDEKNNQVGAWKWLFFFSFPFVPR